MHYKIFMKSRWIITEREDKKDVERLAEELKIPKSLAHLLIARGITTYDDAMRFFKPSLDHLHNPFLMMDMDKSVERIVDAISKKEKVLIFVDYDVDGTSAVALIYSFLQQFDLPF